jgi:uncharacterized protein (DUF58 family)
VISAATRRALDRYALATRELSSASGERSAREAGSSVEFHDFRPYQPGDELRAVDWRAYARSKRLVTRLYQAERTIDVHVVLDVSASMGLGTKAAYARTVAELVTYVGHRDAVTRVHTTAGASSPAAQGRVGLARAWGLIESADPDPAAAAPAAATGTAAPGPVEGVRRFALGLPRVRGAALALVVSDLFDPTPWRGALVALRARGLDAAFLQVVTDDDLDPPEGRFEVRDVETGERRTVDEAEVRAYRVAVQAFVRRTRAALAQAGVAHVLLRVPSEGGSAGRPRWRRPRAARLAAAPEPAHEPEALERERWALAALRRARVLVPR